MGNRRWAALVAAVVAALTTTVVVTDGVPEWFPGAPGPVVVVDDPALADLVVAPPQPAGYDRDLFGPSWSDDVTVAGGRNGCDTRNDILRRDLADAATDPATGGCTVITGTLHDPYTGTAQPFVRGEDSGAQVHIDHLVSLSNAWSTGAHAWDDDKRRDFANDPDNLWAVDGAQNRAKSDHDAAGWLPDDPAGQCALVEAQVAVKVKYELWVTPDEHATLSETLAGCRVSVLVESRTEVP